MSERSDTKLKQREEHLLERFGQHYHDYQYELVNFFAEHLTDLSVNFDGDFQQVLVLAILGQRRLGALRACDGNQAPRQEDMAITSTRLADTTGIPRETVRRKLVLLRERGWVVQSPDGSWLIRAESAGEQVQVRMDLAELDQRGRRRVAKLVARLGAI